MGLVISSSDDEGIDSMEVDSVAGSFESSESSEESSDEEIDIGEYIFGSDTSDSDSEDDGIEDVAERKIKSDHEGVLFGMGNPLLDITVNVEKAYLDKYGLKPNDAVIAAEEHMPIFKEIVEKYTPEYFAGGATQNSIKVAQWMLNKPQATSFIGCIGQDSNGDILVEKAQSVGVATRYYRIEEAETGLCAALICGPNRSLCAHLAAANLYKLDHLKKAENWAYVEKAKFYYLAGFFLTVSPESIMAVAEHSSQNGKVFCMNLSAPFLCQFFLEPMMKALPYADVVFGNETEAVAFSEANKFDTKDIKEIAKKIAALPKVNANKPRTVVITQGSLPTYVVIGSNEVKEFPVIPIKADEIVDTNGAGDAFVGGYLSQMVQDKSLEVCIAGANYAANLIIQRSGCTFPDKSTFSQ